MNKVILTVLCLSFLVVAGCKNKQGSVEEIIRPVKTMQVGESLSDRQWTFSGTAEDALESELSFRVGGKIISFSGDQIGRKFSSGDVVAKLDPADYELEVNQIEAQLEQVRANYTRAKADVDRVTQLYDRKVISKSELDQAVADFKSQEAHLNATAKMLDIARKKLKYTVLIAPFDGWVSKVNVNIHQNVQSGQGVIVFNAGRQMKMSILLPDTLISQVSEGEDVEVTFDALPGKVMKGIVMEVGIGANQRASFPVKVYLNNSDKLLRSGMSGDVNFPGRTGSSHIFVPPSAVVGNPDGSTHVWVIENSTIVKLRKVEIGSLSPIGVQIKEGLKAGETVVTRGVHSLKDGMKVKTVGDLS
ncbi:RND family efflux transporter, MFP subunit [Maridesulfovibrio ferrireducens]|uniref:RND family efflux transporter, MFP subunit n=1 Tax=Maridesulfovibrio ferrireducens TaxID=246191 RepID=A0A1G9JR58_9BACT|nr:efflux RND transporter periplasmic adaptor subunit [Maridesulfovibrio ferrireducens]SDL40018.1 RND family efflux transporter, MFP subunit [Maridesulfovibrio ferrireducens]